MLSSRVHSNIHSIWMMIFMVLPKSISESKYFWSNRGYYSIHGMDDSGIQATPIDSYSNKHLILKVIVNLSFLNLYSLILVRMFLLIPFIIEVLCQNSTFKGFTFTKNPSFGVSY